MNVLTTLNASNFHMPNWIDPWCQLIWKFTLQLLILNFAAIPPYRSSLGILKRQSEEVPTDWAHIQTRVMETRGSITGCSFSIKKLIKLTLVEAGPHGFYLVGSHVHLVTSQDPDNSQS